MLSVSSEVLFIRIPHFSSTFLRAFDSIAREENRLRANEVLALGFRFFTVLERLIVERGLIMQQSTSIQKERRLENKSSRLECSAEH